MFLDILEFTVEKKEKNLFRENCLENVASDLWNRGLFVQKLL